MPRRDEQRPDPYESAIERAESAGEPEDVLPAALHQLRRRRLLLYVGLAAAIVFVLRGGLGGSTPATQGSCTRADFALDRTDVTQGGVIRWSVAGPAAAQAVLAADTAVLPTTFATGRLLGPVPLRGCHASGVLAVPLRPGAHVLRVFLLLPDGTLRDLGSRRLAVDQPR